MGARPRALTKRVPRGSRKKAAEQQINQTAEVGTLLLRLHCAEILGGPDSADRWTFHSMRAKNRKGTTMKLLDQRSHNFASLFVATPVYSSWGRPSSSGGRMLPISMQPRSVVHIEKPG